MSYTPVAKAIASLLPLRLRFRPTGRNKVFWLGHDLAEKALKHPLLNVEQGVDEILTVLEEFPTPRAVSLRATAKGLLGAAHSLVPRILSALVDRIVPLAQGPRLYTLHSSVVEVTDLLRSLHEQAEALDSRVTQVLREALAYRREATKSRRQRRAPRRPKAPIVRWLAAYGGDADQRALRAPAVAQMLDFERSREPASAACCCTHLTGQFGPITDLGLLVNEGCIVAEFPHDVYSKPDDSTPRGLRSTRGGACSPHDELWAAPRAGWIRGIVLARPLRQAIMSVLARRAAQWGVPVYRVRRDHRLEEVTA